MKEQVDLMSAYKLTGSETLGIELGSTRIKAVLIDENCNPVASGSHNWENKLENGYWSYSLDDVWAGIRDAYSSLNREVLRLSGSYIKTLSAIGFSAMMHGYLPFDKNGRQLAEFRTWRNTSTAAAAGELTALFGFNIPQRWSIAHLYQAILNGEEHVKDIDRITTLAGYVHYMLTGVQAVGIGEASGMFPIDSSINDYDAEMLDKFSALPQVKKYSWNIRELLPKVMLAGENAGTLTEKGAALLDESGNLQPGILMCPPEGDAGTGMAATNSVREKTGNVSAGTSIFSMVVLQKPLKNVYEEIDMVTTPAGRPVAMVHCNNCCTDLDHWVDLFYEVAESCGSDITKPQLYDKLYEKALWGSADCGGIVNYNCFSGEPVLHTDSGVPVLIRKTDAQFSLANFFRAQIFSALAALKTGMGILDGEGVSIECINGHGGLFKTPVAGQKLLAGALNTPVAVTKTAGEGGAWGIALLARYAADTKGETLEDYLDQYVFSGSESSVISPDENDVNGFAAYMDIYKKCLAAEISAADALNG